MFKELKHKNGEIILTDDNATGIYEIIIVNNERVTNIQLSNSQLMTLAIELLKGVEHTR